MLIDIEPRKLAQWLTVTHAQRKRAALQAAQMYGADSASAKELETEATQILIQINALTKVAADGPHSSKPHKDK